MKKLLAVIVVALVAAATVWVIGRMQLANRLAAVPELLPETTLALMEVPDFQRARAQWHESDLCQIWREPTVQAWLQRPLARLAAGWRRRPPDPGGFSPARADPRFRGADFASRTTNRN